MTGAWKAAGNESDQITRNKQIMSKANDTPFGAGYVHSELLTRREAAAYLGVAEQTLAVWKCTRRYDLPYVKIGKLVKYRRVDLDEFIAKNLRSA